MAEFKIHQLRVYEESQAAAPRQVVLRLAAESAGCQAAGLYLLDDATTQLELRTAWNLPPESFAAGARPLAGALGDLEALCGHAVVLTEPAMFDFWHAPARFATAVCVPVSTRTMPLGTAWFFSDRPREFSDADVERLERAAGQLAIDVEHELLAARCAGTEQPAGDVRAAARFQQEQLPRIAPLVDGWRLAGSTHHAHELGGNFHDWFVRDDGQLVVTLGQCRVGGLPAALAASGLRASLRAHARLAPSPAEALAEVNTDLWCASAGDQFADACCGWIDPAGGRLRWASSGEVSAAVVRPEGCQTLVKHAGPLGQDPSLAPATGESRTTPGDVFLLVGTGGAPTTTAPNDTQGIQALAQAVQRSAGQPAQKLVEICQAELQLRVPKLGQDWSVLVAQFVGPD